MTLNEVRCTSVRQFPDALLVSRRSSAYWTDHISHLSIMSQKTTQKTLTLFVFVVVMIVLNHFAPRHNVAKDKAENRFFFLDFFFIVVMIVLNQFLPEALSPFTKPKKLNNLARSINERPRPNQVPAKNVECRGGSIVSS